MLVVLFGWAVNFFLLQGTNHLAGRQTAQWPLLAASALGGIYGGAGLFLRCSFVGLILWRILTWGIVVCIAFGIRRITFRLGCLFALLSLALEGLASAMGNGQGMAMLACAGILLFLCRFGFSGGTGETLLPLEIHHGGKVLRLTALHDTGNTLRDPVTGEAVLVLGPEAAGELTGLTLQEIRMPIQTMEKGKYSGLRLIPYHTVGGNGLMLGIRLEKAVIGKHRISPIAAFAPERIEQEGRFQALTGGMNR